MKEERCPGQEVGILSVGAEMRRWGEGEGEAGAGSSRNQKGGPASVG